MINNVSTGSTKTSTSAATVMFPSQHSLHLDFRSQRDPHITHTVTLCCLSFIVNPCEGPSQDRFLDVKFW